MLQENAVFKIVIDDFSYDPSVCPQGIPPTAIAGLIEANDIAKLGMLDHWGFCFLEDFITLNQVCKSLFLLVASVIRGGQERIEGVLVLFGLQAHIASHGDMAFADGS